MEPWILKLRALLQKPVQTSLEALEPLALMAQTAFEESLSLKFLLLRNEQHQRQQLKIHEISSLLFLLAS